MGLCSPNLTLAQPLGAGHVEWFQNYPNPFNPTTGVRYQVSEVSYVRLAVYDLLGREVAVLVNERKAPGKYELRFDGSSLASGVYVYRLTARLTEGGQAGRRLRPIEESPAFKIGPGVL